MKVQSVKIIVTIMAGFLPVSSAAVSHAAIIANFTDGEGTSFVDQHPGIPGSGWANAWSAGTSSASQVRAAINTSPLNGGGNYLNVDATVSAATGVARVSRQYSDFGDVDVDTMSYVISFNYRANTALGLSSATNSASNRYNIIGSTSGTTSTGSGNTWIAGVYAGTDGAPNDQPSGFSSSNIGNWVFLDNTGDTTVGMNLMSFWDSEMALATDGTVYHFEILVDPVNREYKPSISNGSTTATSPNFLGFRNQSTTASTFLQFHAFMTTASSSLSYSVDNIAISIVPEPNSLYFLSMGTLGLIALRRRRKVACC